ncbi:PDZ domain-containing protein [Trebonia kvetii]|uniref:endopeptidase La n=1 Tax=Trebonia kvetii TaxID=2480626 RepID=A0A6P2CAX7_9ACTN|nr:PDZ domain-containing protein [Trebonia kvetii]TVZ07101.1 PDZ domain-containing protein [Trebonia kvetii]
MSRRSLTLAIAGLATVIGIVITVLVPVPYVILGAGPTLNTLGKDSKGAPLITISGHQTYPAAGHLNMVTVSYEGGPGSNLNIFQALRSWLDPSQAVVPESELFPPGQTAQQTQAQDTAQMASSQQLATAAAFTQLHIKYETQVVVLSTVAGYPASKALKPGDVIQEVDGKPVTGQTSLSSLITSRPAGSTLQLTVLRGGKTLTVPVQSKSSGGTPVIGVQVQEHYKFPFTVQISVGDIGGPSAGMMFALGIIDKLTPDNLTGGKFIAGTGEITAAGQVQPIGGIQQKMVGARDAGATVFLAPAANCADTKGAVPAGLRVVKVATLSQAVSDLEAIKAGKSVPSC